MAADRLRGLTSAEAAFRLRAAGPNVLPAVRGPSPVVLLLRQMIHFFALMLWFAAGLAWIAGMPQLSLAIAVVVLLNGAFSFAQEWRADRAGRRLRDLMPAKVVVVRDGRRISVDAATLVVGDVVALEAGDRISADAELADAVDLSVDESMLTGESVPARPGPGTPPHGHPVAGPGRAADGRSGRPRAPPRVGGDAGEHHLHLHRQDRHADPQRDDRRPGVDAGGHRPGDRRRMVARRPGARPAARRDGGCPSTRCAAGCRRFWTANWSSRALRTSSCRAAPSPTAKPPRRWRRWRRPGCGSSPWPGAVCTTRSPTRRCSPTAPTSWNATSSSSASSAWRTPRAATSRRRSRSAGTPGSGSR